MGLLEGISLSVGIIGTAIAIYQWAIINESKKRSAELQYLLAGISQMALSKHQAWNTQIRINPQPKNEHDLKVMQVQSRARDDFMGIHALVSALEGTINIETSAITAMMEKTLKQGEVNNKIQQVRQDTNVDNTQSEH